MNICLSFFKTLPYFFLCFPFCSLSQAQDSTIVRRINDQILGQELQRQGELEKNFREFHPPADQEGEAEKEPGGPDEKSAKTFLFQDIVLEGGTLLSEDEQKELVQEFLHHPLSLDNLNKLLGNITNHYIEKGYVTARAYLKPQHLKTGVLRVTLVEGKVESLTLLDNDEKRTGSGNALPDIEGEPLNMRDLEQGIDQINRLTTHDAKMSLEPGSKAGGTQVSINTQVERPWSLSVATDNYGSQATGQKQLEFAGQCDDMFGFYESFAGTYRKDLALEVPSKRSRSFTGQFSVPNGYWMFRFNGSAFEYLTTVSGQLQDFRFTGNSLSYKGELERIIHRNGDGKTGVSGALAYRSTRNYIADSLLTTGSHQLCEGTLRVFHVRHLLGGVLNGSLSYGQGLRLFGVVKDDSVLDATKPRAQFKRGDLGRVIN
jgi:hemolysin activation/secretion protein